MVFYIVVLRALAACLITNSHYGGIYPFSFLGSGGLLGDLLFFTISGWCLCNICGSFFRWYGKRLLRILPPVMIISALYLLLGQYPLETEHYYELFLYPTEYHFVASILVLYILYYAVMKIRLLREHLPAVMAAIAAAYFAVYILKYDKSYYHIDVVQEPIIRFLFAESMLLGAWFRQKNGDFHNRYSRWLGVALILLLGAHFGAKMFFGRTEHYLPFQILSQVIVFALLFVMMRFFQGADAKLEAMPKTVKKGISFLASIALEIYLVQGVIIRNVAPLLPFPFNWLAVSAAIFVAAVVLHLVWKYLLLGIQILIKYTKKSFVS